MKLHLALLFSLCISILGAQVVINELYYDHPGVDTGNEWIELYNAGVHDVNLEGARILKAGSSFVQVFEFPRFILRAGRYLLLAESKVDNAHFYATLAFQNGGGATDGVRFVSADESYKDTVLYDTPNSNELPDDTGNVATSFASRGPAGTSLARIVNGFDTDDCAIDWVVETNPTPANPNPHRIDFALDHAKIWPEADSWLCEVWVKNLSPAPSSCEVKLQFYLDEVNVEDISLGNIPASDSLLLQAWIPIADEEEHQIRILLDHPSDPDQSNNQLYLNVGGSVGESGIVLNEIMYRPAVGEQEWIELWQSGSSGGSYYIQDRSGGSFDFEIPGRRGYFVLCTSAERLQARYPECDANSIIEVKRWTALNNDGDDIYLFDADEELIDSMSYASGATQADQSLERYEREGEVLWRASLDESGATPGRENSKPHQVPDTQKRAVEVFGSPAKVRAGEYISVSFKFNEPQSKVSCKVWSRAGQLVRVLAANSSTEATGELIWDGRDSQGKYVGRGLYFISWHSVSSSGKQHERQFSVAVY
ncbi:MAG TPA: lamin tail domain-containing protein [Candidatus Cloacimonadota bacterium]|nr:lamin tail domain-containing protein [Candidatus Cloacimonadota bacterium]